MVTTTRCHHHGTFALLGATSAIWLRGMPNDIYSDWSGCPDWTRLKNAILIVEFASQNTPKGWILSPPRGAARLRFRPIVGYLLAFVLGVFPQVESGRCRCCSRQSMEPVSLQGYLAATFITTIFINSSSEARRSKQQPLSTHNEKFRCTLFPKSSF